MIQEEEYIVSGGLQTLKADIDIDANVATRVNTLDYLLLKNALPDVRIGALVKRSGSVSEAIGAVTGIPNAMIERLSGTSTGLLPTKRELLLSFSGSTWKTLSSGSWVSVTKSTHTSFNATKQYQFAQIGNNVFIAGGRPAKWGGVGNTIERVGIPAPTSAPSLAVGSATGLTGTFQYMYTWVNSTTGLESDWSPLGSITVSNQKVDITLPTTAPAADGVDTKRLYRTFDNGSLFYKVADIALATATYTDSTADADLGAASDSLGNKALPPEDVFIIEAFNNHIWMVDGSNPYLLKYSKPYIGNDNDLEYFPTTNVIKFDAPITGLARTPGRLYIFHPRGISALSGFSNADFTVAPVVKGVGTVFPNSIQVHGQSVFFLSESGVKEFSGGIKDVSLPIDRELIPILESEYNNNVYVSSAWNTRYKQYVISISAQSTAGAPWIVSDTGVVADWVDSSTGLDAEWEDALSPGSEEVNRFRMWGYNPVIGTWTEYSFSQISDLNNAGAYATFLYHPHPSSDSLDPLQDVTYLGFFDGTNASVLGCFKNNASKDDSSNVVAEVLTSQISPGRDGGGYKRFISLVFKGAYLDPSNNGSSLQYVMDLSDPHIRGFVSSLKNFQGGGDRKVFTTQKGRFVHLYVKDDTANSDNIMLQDFSVQFRELKQREGR
ncbi:MAG: hypothetical protein D6694_12800 [Gammaproteobacteria bacterium]|nr:MAG: hypothetical protein D6694_12800 [Gammaproteobacteria bacterium]